MSHMPQPATLKLRFQCVRASHRQPGQLLPFHYSMHDNPVKVTAGAKRKSINPEAWENHNIQPVGIRHEITFQNV